MLIAICAPAGGAAPELAQLLQATMSRLNGQEGLVFRYDSRPWPGRTLDQVPYSALAALAQRWANPTIVADQLQIPNLDCLREGTPFLSRVKSDHFTPETLSLARTAAAGKPLPKPIVIDSLSRLYEQTLVQVLAAATRGLDHAERAHPVALAHASDALARLCWDLSRAETTVIATLWEVETWRKGKEVGVAPMLPRSALNQIDLWLRALDRHRVVVERSTVEWARVGSEIATTTEADWLALAA